MSQWPRAQIRYLARLGTGHTPSRSNDEYWRDCNIPWLTLADVGQLRDGTVDFVSSTKEMISALGVANSSAVVHPAGTVAMSRTASVGYSCILGTSMATSQDYVTWTCGKRLHPKFLLWVLRGEREVIIGRMQGSTHKTIYMPDVEQMSTPLPPIEDQRAITDYLDTETTRIDALIAKKRRMIELVKERTVEGAEILTLGLNQPNLVPARNRYFTAVPPNWIQTTMRHLQCEVQTGPFGSQLHAEEYVENGHPVVNPANLQAGKIVPLASMTISDEKREELSRHILRVGDIVFGRRGEMGRAGLVEEHHDGWLCGTGSLRLRLSPCSPLLPEYLKLLLETSALKNYLLLSSVGSTMDNLNSEILLDLPALVPPHVVQRRIVKSVAGDRARTNELIERLSRQLDLLAEHRQALITAAVTGELNVAEAA